MAKVPRKRRPVPMSLKMKRALENLDRMSMAERIQLLVAAELMTQEEADQAKRRLAEAAQQTGSGTPEGNGEES